jgi:poly-gamma-glutamate synthesis protein (capsule biosynthesis protein)
MKIGWKTLVSILLVLLLAITVFLQTNFAKHWIGNWGALESQVKAEGLFTKPELPKPTRLVFVGDLMVDRGVENSVKNNMGGDFGKLFEHVGSYFKGSDGVFLNVEGPITAKGENVGSRFSFAMDEKIVPVMVANNVKIVSFANNHVGDRSTAGFLNTLANFEKYGLPYVGAGRNSAEASAVKTIQVNGLKVGFIACSDVGPEWLKATDTAAGQQLCSNPNLPTIIKNAHEQVDFLIFSAHWGIEYKSRTARQQTLAHMAIDNGADIVIGTHPHVVQTTEWYKDKFIAYSVGNFIFDQYFANETMQGLLVDATISKHKIENITMKTIELSPEGNKYQPIEIRDTIESDFLKSGSVTAQTCPTAKDSETNKWLYPVGPDFDLGNYVPKDLIPLNNRINVQTTANCLTELAANALISMVNAMEKENLKVIMTSGFRSRTTQEIVRENSADTQAADADPTKYPSVAKAGHSEHQLGTAVDMKSGNDPAFSYDNFKNSSEFAWLVKNAYKYGFVQSYTNGTESITGYVPEPWHWRYIGIDYATQIRDKGITPYEFLKSLYQQ